MTGPRNLRVCNGKITFLEGLYHPFGNGLYHLFMAFYGNIYGDWYRMEPPSDVCWFINPMNAIGYSYISHKPYSNHVYPN
jgi:hypothetical protein